LPAVLPETPKKYAPAFTWLISGALFGAADFDTLDE
jgi:hypothetical protein